MLEDGGGDSEDNFLDFLCLQEGRGCHIAKLWMEEADGTHTEVLLNSRFLYWIGITVQTATNVISTSSPVHEEKPKKKKKIDTKDEFSSCP